MSAELDALAAQTKQQLRQMAQRQSKASGVNLSKFSKIPDTPFSGLKQEVMAHRHTVKELQAAFRRFRYLITAVYQTVDDSDGPVSYENKAYDECRRKLETNSVFIPGAQGHDAWKPWIACLERIGRHAYQTRIVIDTRS